MVLPVNAPTMAKDLPAMARVVVIGCGVGGASTSSDAEASCHTGGPIWNDDDLIGVVTSEPSVIRCRKRTTAPDGANEPADKQTANLDASHLASHAGEQVHSKLIE